MSQTGTEAKTGMAGADNGGSEGFDMSTFRPASSTSRSRGSADPGVMSVVNSKKNGKRVSLPRAVMDRLNNPKTVQFAFTEGKIAVAEKLPGNDVSFNIRRGKNMAIIYAADLVREIAEQFDLDFTGRTSVTFHDVEYHEVDGYPVAVISVSK